MTYNGIVCVVCGKEKSTEAGKRIPVWGQETVVQRAPYVLGTPSFSEEFVCEECFGKKVKSDVEIVRESFFSKKLYSGRSEVYDLMDWHIEFDEEMFVKSLVIELTARVDLSNRDKINSYLDRIRKLRREHKYCYDEWNSANTEFLITNSSESAEVERSITDKLHSIADEYFGSWISLCDAIIENLNETLTICPKCSSRMPSNASFCGNCGTEIR
jgi:ribosomal protein L40E